MSIGELVRRFRWRVGFTMLLVLVEAAIELLLPLVLGLAINGLLEDDLTGLVVLGVLGVGALVVGSARRYVDTRTYAGVYETVASELVVAEQDRRTPTSAIAARTTLLGEFVEFLENSMPEIVRATIGTVGILVIIAGLDVGVFFACLGLLGLLVVVYWASGRLNFSLNRGYNDELERQVDAIESRHEDTIRGHFRLLMRWNRRLSDLETANYAAIWLGVIALLIYAPIAVIEPGQTEYGYAFSAMIYVFQYIEALVALPLFIQQLIRLREISGRLSAPVGEPEASSSAPGETVAAH